MLDTLIIFAHPDRENSINALILKNFVDGLEKQKASYSIIDLYADKFDPVFCYEELRNGILSDEVQKYHKLILNHKKLVFIYPAWNYGIPAILKGWIDRVLVIPGFSFQEDEKHGYLEGSLTHEKALLFQTFGGSFDGENKAQLSYYSEPVSAILKFCGLSNVDVEYFFNLYKISLNYKEAIKNIQNRSYGIGINF